jgi:hypothetical protein
VTIAQQKRFYFPAWNQCADRNDWVMVKGKLLATRPEAGGLAEADQLLQKIWTAADKIAREAHRAITATDLRHACHIVALGKDCSSHEMTNNQTDRVVNLFRLLANPDDIKAARAWSDPEEAERNRLTWSIKKMAPEAYISAICENRHDWNYTAPFWEDLPLAQLRQLAMTLRNRVANRKEPLTKSEPATTDEMTGPQMVNVGRNNDPF